MQRCSMEAGGQLLYSAQQVTTASAPAVDAPSFLLSGMQCTDHPFLSTFPRPQNDSVFLKHRYVLANVPFISLEYECVYFL